MSVELHPASSLGLEQLAGLFNAGYENYVIPFQLDQATLRFMVETYDLDLDASRVAYRDGEPVGLVNLGLRGERAWIGGVGVVVSARRQGVGETLMRAAIDEARRRGVQELGLEVIVENRGAIELYEKLGFETLREVEVWTVDASDAEANGGGTLEITAEEAHARVRALRRTREPWQRADETLAHLGDVRGMAAGDGAALFRVANDRASLLQIAGDGDARALVAALRSHGAVSALNLPAGEAAANAFLDLGGKVVVRQLEMALPLGPA